MTDKKLLVTGCICFAFMVLGYLIPKTLAAANLIAGSACFIWWGVRQWGKIE